MTVSGFLDKHCICEIIETLKQTAYFSTYPVVDTVERLVFRYLQQQERLRKKVGECTTCGKNVLESVPQDTLW